MTFFVCLMLMHEEGVCYRVITSHTGAFLLNMKYFIHASMYRLEDICWQ